MNCPKCDSTMTGSVCPECRFDMIIYNRTKRVSDILYNKGLERAKVNDFSGALDALLKSIEFNKLNFNARNLLGLIYFETGKISLALKHWVISSSLKKDDNLAKAYIDSIQKNTYQLEKYNDAIKMYNQALSYMKQKSEDMAIIQLKKALDLNPTFIDALNLLTYCYIMTKETDKAVKICEKVLSLDTNNTVAQNYAAELQIGKTKQDRKSEPRKKTVKSKSTGYSKNTNYHFAEILSFVIGAVSVLAVIYILVLPSIIEERDNLVESARLETQSTKDERNAIIVAREKKIQQLEAENSSLKDKNKSLNDSLKARDAQAVIKEVTDLFTAKKYMEATEMIYALDVTDLPQSIVESVTMLKNDTSAQYAKQLYDAGVKEYNAKRYQGMKEQFEKCLFYVPSTATYLDHIYYLLGIVAEDIDKDNATARSYYEKVVNEYPTSNYLTRIKTRLQRLPA